MLKFFCTCGHSRGKHDNSTGFRFMVGGCNSCKCNKYKSDKKRNKRANENYAKILLKNILSPLALLLLFVLLIDQLDELLEGTAKLLYLVLFFFTFLYFKVLKPLDKFEKKILSR